MAILSVDEIKGKRASTIDRLWQRTYTRVFRVTTDGPMNGALSVRAAKGVPAPGTAYTTGTEHDFGAFAGPVSAQEETEDGKSWLVTVEYGPYDMNQFGSDPTTWPPKVQFGLQKYDRIVQQDQTGAAIVNSAGDPFADPVTIDDSRSVLTVTRNENIQLFDFTISERYRDTINSGSWQGFDTKTVKCSSITTGEPQYDSNNRIYYYTVTYVFEVNRDTWKSQPLDQGFQYLDGSGKLVAVLDDKGQRKDEPALLDGSGHISTGAPTYLSFDVYPSQDFSAFNLDLTRALGKLPPSS